MFILLYDIIFSSNRAVVIHDMLMNRQLIYRKELKDGNEQGI